MKLTLQVLNSKIDVLSELMVRQFAELGTVVRDGFRNVDQRFDRVEGRLDKVEGRLDKVEGRLDRVEVKLDKLEKRQDRTESAVSKLSLMIAGNHEELITKLDAFVDAQASINRNVDARLTSLSSGGRGRRRA